MQNKQTAESTLFAKNISVSHWFRSLKDVMREFKCLISCPSGMWETPSSLRTCPILSLCDFIASRLRISFREALETIQNLSVWFLDRCQLSTSFHDSLHEILDVRWTANAYSFSIDAKGEVLELGTRGASAMPSFISLAHATAQAVAQRQGGFQQPLGNLVLHRLTTRK